MIQFLKWDVVEKPIQIAGGKLIPSKKALVRTDTGDVLEVANKTYKPMYNSAMNDIVNQIYPEIQNYKVYEIDGGRKIMIQVMIGKQMIGNDTVFEYLNFVNSHDGSTSFFVNYSNRVMFCTNQMYYFKNTAQFKIRHSTNLEKNVETVVKKIEQVEALKDGRNEMFKNFTDIDFHESLIEIIVDDLLGEKKTKEHDVLTSCIEESCANHGGNLWGIMNGVTYYTNHKAETKDRIKYLLFGKGADINERAFKFLEEYYEMDREHIE